jgi:hypothetical protein
VLIRYKQPAGIPAARAGPYGRKNTRGNFPRAFYFDILTSFASTTMGKSIIQIINIPRPLYHIKRLIKSDIRAAPANTIAIAVI